MKVRIGVGAGPLPDTDPASLGALIDELEDLGFDSIWLPEILTAGTLDPLVALAWCAAHNARLKLGTTVLVTGRNVLRVAKQLATVDRLSNGRLLVTFVPGLAIEPESSAIGVTPGERGTQMEEVLPLLRQLWAGQTVSHDGPSARLSDVRLGTLPVQSPLEFWTGGMLPSALDRCGRLADGWLPSACTPDEADQGRHVIEEAAAQAGRLIDPEHFGVSLAYSTSPLSDATVAGLARARKGVDPTAVVPVGPDGLRRRLEEFIRVGFSKFVVRPLPSEPGQPPDLQGLADVVLDLQT